jgi:hypothetical protein
MTGVINTISDNRSRYSIQSEILKTTFQGGLDLSKLSYKMDDMTRPNVKENLDRCNDIMGSH